MLSKSFIQLVAPKQELITASKESRDVELEKLPNRRQTGRRGTILKMMNFRDGWLLPGLRIKPCSLKHSPGAPFLHKEGPPPCGPGPASSQPHWDLFTLSSFKLIKPKLGDEDLLRDP